MTIPADLDPRVEVYRTMFDPLTPQTLLAYAHEGAKAGMMLDQLIQMLAAKYPRFIDGLGQQ